MLGTQTTQAVILAAGKGTRMRPLTDAVPKPLQEILGRSLLAYKLDVLPASIDDVVIVIGHLGEQIVSAIGERQGTRTIRYIAQSELNGTAGALLSARSLLRERFLVLMGDDLYDANDLAHLAEEEMAIGIAEVCDREIGGEIIRKDDGTLLEVREARHRVDHGFICTGAYALTQRFFAHAPVAVPGSLELGIPQTLASIAREAPVALVPFTRWMQITSPEDLVRAQEFVRMKS
ncbi:MAG TPA: nucleotidyltransferase family protein [Candidatus Paceibacterota bacterium]|nr:nucleotidyltransferase family protein [Candidatus Paceibacterota bacterium]